MLAFVYSLHILAEAAKIPESKMAKLI